VTLPNVDCRMLVVRGADIDCVPLDLAELMEAVLPDSNSLPRPWPTGLLSGPDPLASAEDRTGAGAVAVNLLFDQVTGSQPAWRRFNEMARDRPSLTLFAVGRPYQAHATTSVAIEADAISQDPP
jgi:hypothetical protein